MCFVGGSYHQLLFESYEASTIPLQVCPICSVKVARDMLTHIRMQHGHLLKISFVMEMVKICSSPLSYNHNAYLYNKKILIVHFLWLMQVFSLIDQYLQRRRRLRRVAVPDSQTLSLLGRDLHEAHLQVLLGGGAYRSSTVTPSTAATDPLISSLIMNYPTPEAEEIAKAVTSCTEDSSTKNTASRHLWKSRYINLFMLYLPFLLFNIFWPLLLSACSLLTSKKRSTDCRV